MSRDKTDKLTKSQDQLSGSTKKLTKNQDGQWHVELIKELYRLQTAPKTFSKMQQSIDGGGGAGGLVRAYALLAANVFALSAAFQRSIKSGSG